MPISTELSLLYSMSFSPVDPKFWVVSPLCINLLSLGEFVFKTIDEAPVSTRKLSESEPLTKAVTYIRLSSAIEKGITPTGSLSTIRAFAHKDASAHISAAAMLCIDILIIELFIANRTVYSAKIRIIGRTADTSLSISEK